MNGGVINVMCNPLVVGIRLITHVDRGGWSVVLPFSLLSPGVPSFSSDGCYVGLF